MTLSFSKAAILGATGPTGKWLARELIARGLGVRVVSRSASNLARAFGQLETEQTAADMLDPEAAQRVVEGCDLVVDCIGLPMEHITDHPSTATNIAAAARAAGARCVHVSSYWAYIPIVELPVTEDHPRHGGNLAARMRRQAEDILLQAGAAVLNLPDFYGPEVHTSTLQQPLAEAVAGKTANWIGSLRIAREYIYVPDAMKVAAALAHQQAAYAQRWIVSGAGLITADAVMKIAGDHLGRPLRLRGAGPLMLRLIALFMPTLRPFLPMVPTYAAPIRFDGSKLHSLLGKIATTPYEEGIPATLDWLAANLLPTGSTSSGAKEGG